MTNPRLNPYVGPEPFKTGQRMYGRDRETLGVLDLLIAERIVLFYSPSGAGKTSLLQAGLIPLLINKGFDVLPIIRVNKAPSADKADLNRYLASALLSLDEDSSLQNDLGLAEYLDSRMEKESKRQVLIFDQFEEILTLDPLDEKAKGEFFVQLGDILSNRKRWAIFSMREDYVAGLDPLFHPIPTQFSNTYRLDLLKRTAALEAIQEPARQSGVEFSDLAAGKLAEDLAQVIVQQPDQSFKIAIGQYVEPVQLQVVCFRLWENLEANDQEISERDIKEVGDVNTALADYYADWVQKIAKNSGESERRIRKWFDTELIRGNKRNLVLKEEGRSRGLWNHTIHMFEDAHLIRAEQRGGTIWFELIHDRFIEPIQASNAAWFEANLSAIQQQAELWSNENRDPAYLITGQALIKGEEWVNAHKIELTPTDKEFLNECHAKQDSLEREQKQNRRVRWLAIGASVLCLIALCALALALWQQRIAQSREMSARALVKLNTDPRLSVLTALQALYIADTAEAETSLRKALVKDRLIAVLDDNPSWVSAGIFSSDGSRILIASGNVVRILDADTYEIVNELEGHGGSINSASFSPDSRLVVTASEDNTARVWDLSRCNPDCKYLELIGHDEGVSAAIFNPDGTRVATLSKDKTVGIWDALTGKKIFDLENGKPEFVRISYSPDGKKIAAGGEDFNVYLYKAITGERLISLPGHTGEITCIAFSSEGQWIASASKDNSARIWEISTGKPLAELKGHSDRITGITFSPDDALILTASADQTARVWDWWNETQVSEMRGHTGAVNSAVFSRDMKLILTASADHTARLWETSSGHSLATFLGHTDWVYGAGFDPGEKRIISISADRSARLWNADPRDEVVKLGGHALSVKSVAVSPDGKYVVTASVDNTAQVFDATNGHVVAILSGHKMKLNRAAFSPDGRYVATASEDNTARIWDLEDCHPDCKYVELKGHNLGVKSAQFSLDGKWVVTASNDYTAKIWDRTTGGVTREFPHKDFVFDASFSPDGLYIVTASADLDPVATVWDVQTGELIVELEGHQDALTSASFSPDGTKIVTASRDNTVRIWDWKACRKNPKCTVAEFKGAKWFLDAEFDPEGSWIATASSDGLVRVWNWKTGKIVSILEENSGAVNGCIFSPDTRFLLTANSDGTAHIWPRASFAPFQEVITMVCRQIGDQIPNDDNYKNVRDFCATQLEENSP